MSKKKLIVVGLDGANWKLIEPWLKELPNIANLRAKGCWGDLKSCLPPVTVPNWKCYSTGKNPGKLGVYWFERIDCKNRKLEMSSSDSYKSLELWDYLNKHGIKTGIVNMPTTYPPKKVNGFLVSGGPDAEYSLEGGYTYPKNFAKYLKENFNYKIHPDKLLTSKKEVGEEVEEILKLIESRFKVALDILPKVNFLHITIFYLNVLQHFFFRGEPTKRAWKIVDKYIGKLSEMGTIVLMSDHGCKKIEQEFFINTWLKKEGYLKTKVGVDDFLKVLGMTQENFVNFFKKFKILKLMHKTVPKFMQTLIPSEGGAQFERKIKKIDWEKTKAVGSGQGLIYLNLDKNSPEFEKTRKEIIKKLRKLKYKGKKVAAGVYKSEDVYWGPYINKSPNIIFEQASWVHTNGGVGRKNVFSAPKKWEAENIRTGLFLAYGDEIREGAKIREINIVDLAPTILHMFNLKIPDDMDGKVLKKIFKSKSGLSSRKIKFLKVGERKESVVEFKKDKEKVKKRLSALGYLD